MAQLDLVEINSKTLDVIIDLRYAGPNNVCGHKLYSNSNCYLLSEAYEKLKKVVGSLKNLGLKIKIWDAYRPLSVQKYMFEKFSHDEKYQNFISNPETGSIPHCRGIAIDLTLTDLEGKELDMGTDFDNFSELAFHNCQKVSIEARRNRLILLGIMSVCGFDFYSQEWWHYQLFKPRDYEIINHQNFSELNLPELSTNKNSEIKI